MRLNLDCVRDILLCVEDNTGYRRCAVFVDADHVERISRQLGCEAPSIQPYQQELMEKYSNQEIMYHFQYCISADLIETDGNFGTQKFLVADLTPKGHETISNLRSPKVFKLTKKIAEQLGIRSLEGICKIASSIVSEIIQSHLNI